MTIKDFLNTKNGKRYKEVLNGCDNRWQCEYFENINQYIDILRDNKWSDEDIIEHCNVLDKYKENETDKDFVIVIN